MNFGVENNSLPDDVLSNEITVFTNKCFKPPIGITGVISIFSKYNDCMEYRNKY